MPPIIRDFRPDDIETLDDLCRRAMAHWGYTPDYCDIFFSRVDVPTEIPDADMAYVATDDNGAILGYTALNLEPPPPFLEHIHVAPEAWGLGVGRALMDHTLREAAKAGARAVELMSEPKAEGFYVRVGGVRIGVTESEIIPGRMLPRFRFDVLHCGSA